MDPRLTRPLRHHGIAPSSLAGMFVGSVLMLTGSASAQDHQVHHGGTVFTPTVVYAERGDVIRWGIGGPGGTPRTITSGEDCVHDGLYFDATIPPGIFDWQVPMDIAVTEIPYFNALACKTGTPGLIRIIDIREVPGEYLTIQEALDAADEYDTILIAAGTYHETDLTPGVDNILIQGELGTDGNPSVFIGPKPGTGIAPPIMSINDLEGVTVRDIHFVGNSRKTGGPGMAISSSDPVIENCLFTNVRGGGVSCINGEPTFDDCIFDANESDDGGAAFFEQSAVTLLDCMFINNMAQGSGGAITALQSDVSIIECRIEGNTASDSGGGISAADSVLVMTECEIRENMATLDAGGIMLQDGSTTISETRICGNTPGQISGKWTPAGGNIVRDDCSILYVPEDFSTIDDAVDAARDGDTIMIAAGIYGAPGIIEDAAVSLIGEKNRDGSPAVIIDGVLGLVRQGTKQVTVENLEVTTMVLYDSTASVINCNIQFGNDQFAGVILGNFNGSLQGCRIADCSSGFLPGGVYVSDQIDNPEIPATDAMFIDCVIENNAGGCPFPGCGGDAGVYIADGTVDFIGCTVRDNISDFGGMFISPQATSSLTNTTVCGNSTTGQIVGAWTDNGGNFVADECPADCPGDLDGNGLVDGGDLGQMLGAWGTNNPIADLNGDLVVDGVDLGVLLGNWGLCIP